MSMRAEGGRNLTWRQFLLLVPALVVLVFGAVHSSDALATGTSAIV